MQKYACRVGGVIRDEDTARFGSMLAKQIIIGTAAEPLTVEAAERTLDRCPGCKHGEVVVDGRKPKRGIPLSSVCRH